MNHSDPFSLFAELQRSLELVEVEGGLFIRTSFHRVPRVLRAAICWEENSYNHFHFNRLHSAVPKVNFLINLELAEKFCAEVRVAIASAHPERSVALFVVNEFHFISDADSGTILGAVLEPTVRMWTRSSSADADLDSIYMPRYLARDLAWIRLFETSFLIPIAFLDFTCPFLGLKSLSENYLSSQF